MSILARPRGPLSLCRLAIGSVAALALTGCVADTTGVSDSADSATSAGSTGPGSSTGEDPGATSQGETSAGGTVGSATSDSTGQSTVQGGSPLCAGALSDSWNDWDDTGANAYTFAVTEVNILADLCDGEVNLACTLRTEFTVAGGAVTGRTLVVTPSDDITDPTDCPEPYVEVGDEVGSHADGFSPSTIPDVYQECCDLADQQGGYFTDYEDGWDVGDLIIEFENDGMISACSTRYCDDCGCDGGIDYTISDIVL